jgi:anti-anti-sigma factor
VAQDQRHQEMVIVTASGEIDDACAPKLSAALHREIDSGKCRLLVVDLRAVYFLSRQGIVVLTKARQHADAYQIGFALIANAAIRHLLQPLETVENFPDWSLSLRSIDQGERRSE